MKLRQHDEADHAAISELRWLLKTDDGRRTEGKSKEEFLRLYRQHLARRDRDGGTLHWLFEEDGAIVGVMTLRIV